MKSVDSSTGFFSQEFSQEIFELLGNFFFVLFVSFSSRQLSCGFFAQVFEKPMADSGVVKLEDVETIFVNWKDLIACNNTFLR